MSALLPVGTLALTDDERLLGDSAREFLAERAPITSFRKLRDTCDPNGFSGQLWKEMAKLGWIGVALPELHGGAGLGIGGAAVLSEVMGRTLVASPFLSTAVIVTTALSRYASPALCERWLPRILDGSAVGALAIDERPRHDPSRMVLSATPDGEVWHLCGEKIFVEDGHVADVLVVVARLSDGGLGLFLVERNSPGLQVERVHMVDGRNSANVRCNRVCVTAAGKLNADFSAMETLLDAGRTVLAAELCGATGAMLALTVDHLNQRKQFGATLSSFQALQHRVASLYVESELARSAARAAARQIDRGAADAATFVSVAKAKTSTVATLAAAEAVQLHGGMGMTDELDIGLYMKRVRVACERYGDASFHADRLGSLHDY